MAARDRIDVLEVIDGGLLTTVQDEGRFGYEADGVPESGAADPVGLAVANALLGNAMDAAALEVTLLGLRVRAIVDVDVAIGGADLGAVIDRAIDGAPGGTPVSPGSSVRLRAGDLLAVRGSPDDAAAGGCRAYLAVPGGIDVPELLGSRSTCLPAMFGGLDGRPLRAGDRIAAAGGATAKAPATRRLSAAAAAELPSAAQRLRVLPGPASAEGDPAFQGLVGQAWIVSPSSDRRGLRLEPANPGSPAATSALGSLAGGELPSHGVRPGAVQLTPSGQPLVLMPDAGTTGGYPVIAVVASADLAVLGQLGPGAEVRFKPTTPDEARAAALDRRRVLAELASRIS